MQSLTLLTSEMRALGIRSLHIELDTPIDPTYTEPAPATEAVASDPDKPAGLCAYGNCRQPRGGIFGTAVEYCADHALTEGAGVKR